MLYAFQCILQAFCDIDYMLPIIEIKVQQTALLEILFCNLKNIFKKKNNTNLRNELLEVLWRTRLL